MYLNTMKTNKYNFIQVVKKMTVIIKMTNS